MHQQAKQSHNSTLRHREGFPSPHTQYTFIIKIVPTTFLSLKQHYWKIVTNSFFIFQKKYFPIILFKMFTSLWSNFQNRWHFYFTRSSLFSAFTKQECNPCCFLWIGIFKSYFENYSKIFFNLAFSETQHRKVDWRWIHFKWCGLGCSKHIHTRKSLLYFLIVLLNLW